MNIAFWAFTALMVMVLGVELSRWGETRKVKYGGSESILSWLIIFLLFWFAVEGGMPQIW